MLLTELLLVIMNVNIHGLHVLLTLIRFCVQVQGKLIAVDSNTDSLTIFVFHESIHTLNTEASLDETIMQGILSGIHGYQRVCN